MASPTDASATSRTRGQNALLVILGLPVGVALAWLTLMAASFVPSESVFIWLGLPLLAVGTAGTVATKHSTWLGVPLAVAGVLTLAFFVWLFWSFGQGSQDF